MESNNKRFYFDKYSTKQVSETKEVSDADDVFDDDAALDLRDDAPPDQADDAAPELAIVICKLCQLIRHCQTVWKMTHCPSERIEREHYHLDLVVPGCKAMNIDMCVHNGRAVMRSEL